MRIIITSNGKTIIQRLPLSSSCPDLFHKYQSKSVDKPFNHYLQNSQNEEINSPNEKSLISNNINFQNNEESKSTININNNIFSGKRINLSMQKEILPKIVKIKEHNLKIPALFMKKYEKDDAQNQIVKQSSSVLSILENNIINDESKISNSRILSHIENSKEESNNNSIFLPKIKSCYSIGEIINPNCFEKLNEEINKKIDEEKYDKKIDSSSLRKQIDNRKIFDEINENKNKIIDANNYKLIEYLMKKTTITKNLLKKINDSGTEKLSLLNKISNKILIDKERQKSLNEKIKIKLERDKDKENQEFRQGLLDIKNKANNNIKKIHLSNYKLDNDNRKGVYKNVFKNFRRQYWKKSDNFARYFPKEQRIHYEELE